MNMNERDRLITAAIGKRQTGQFQHALSVYLDALRIDPYHAPIYFGLAGTNYLLGDRFTALRGYLAAMHLRISETEREMIENPSSSDSLSFNAQYDALCKERKQVLPAKSGFIIFYDRNLAKHAAHAFFDLDNNYPELEKYGQVYRAEALGDGAFQFMLKQWAMSEADYRCYNREFYVPKGQEFFFQVIQWRQIADRDVLNIYFKSTTNNPDDILQCNCCRGLPQAG